MPTSRAPQFKQYLGLIGGVWAFLVLLGFMLIRYLRQSIGSSSRGIIMFCAILGLGFLIVCVFDYLWLRFASSPQVEPAKESASKKA